MDIQTLLEHCSQLGATITPTERGTLKIRASSPLPDDLREELKRHKPVLWLKTKLNLGPQRISDLTREWLGDIYLPGQSKWMPATHEQWNRLMAAKMLLEVEVSEDESGFMCWRLPQRRTVH